MKSIIVAPNGSDINSAGTELDPFATVEYALKRAEPGDQILIREGEYSESPIISKSGTAMAPITIAAYEDEEPFFVGSRDRSNIFLIDASYVVLENLNLNLVNPSKDKTAWVVITSKASRVTMRMCTLVRPLTDAQLDAAARQREWNDMGIVIEGDNVTIDSCRLAGMFKGVHIKGQCKSPTVTHCYIGPTVQSNIVLGTSKGMTRGALIAFNVLEKSYIEDGIQFIQDFDYKADSGRTATPAEKALMEKDISNIGTIVYRNVIRNHNDNAIDLKGAGDVVIDGNVFYDIKGSNNGPLGSDKKPGWNREARGAIGRGARTSCRQVIVRNNVVYNCNAGIALFDQWKLYNNVILWNNIDAIGGQEDWVRPNFCGIDQSKGLVMAGSMKNNVIGFHKVADIALPLAHKNDIDIDYNLYAGGRWINRQTKQPTRLNTLESWQTALRTVGFKGYDQHSSVVQSAVALQFVNLLAQPTTRSHEVYDFNSARTSPAYQSGGPLTFTTSAGSGAVVPVKDAGYFTDWFGRTDVPDELVYMNGKEYKVVKVDYEQNTIKLNKDAEWTANTPVFWGAEKPNRGLQPRDIISGPPDPDPDPEPQLVPVELQLELSVNSDIADRIRALLTTATITVV